MLAQPNITALLKTKSCLAHKATIVMVEILHLSIAQLASITLTLTRALVRRVQKVTIAPLDLFNLLLVSQDNIVLQVQELELTVQQELTTTSTEWTLNLTVTTVPEESTVLLLVLPRLLETVTPDITVQEKRQPLNKTIVL